MKPDLMKKTAILASIFSALSLAIIFFAAENAENFNLNRHGMGMVLAAAEEELTPDTGTVEQGDEDAGLADSGTDAVTDTAMPGVAAPMPKDGEEKPLSFELGNTTSTNFLSIPLPEGIAATDITIENHYMDEEMRVVIGSAAGDFYAAAPIGGNRRNIVSGSYINMGEDAILRFILDGSFECRSIMEEGRIYIEFVPPREMYDKIVVIDPAYGGSEYGISANELDEKDLTLDIAIKLKELLDETDIKVYYTRLADNNQDEEKRVRIANNARVDMLIRIEGDADADSRTFGTTAIYNETFFIPHFNSVELADVLEREVVLSIIGKAVGLKAATADDYVIANATVPAAAIRVGYLTNTQEATLLKREDYLEKIARGIYNAIMEIYDE